MKKNYLVPLCLSLSLFSSFNVASASVNVSDVLSKNVGAHSGQTKTSDQTLQGCSMSFEAWPNSGGTWETAYYMSGQVSLGELKTEYIQGPIYAGWQGWYVDETAYTLNYSIGTYLGTFTFDPTTLKMIEYSWKSPDIEQPVLCILFN